MTPFLSLGFRPFFLGASVFSALSIALWVLLYRGNLAFDLVGIAPSQWHAHEMIFGFALAVIAGFLLTAARNWTNQETASGLALALLFLAWAAARLLLLPGVGLVLVAGVADMAFMLGLGFAVARPILKVRQKRQAPVLLLLSLLILANLSFYLGAAGWYPAGIRLGLQGGLYLVLGMVLFMGSRVIPFFTQRGVGYEVEIRQQRWNDVATFTLFPLFLLSEVLLPRHLLGALAAAGLLILNSLRVSGWYTPGIWRKPLLWGLFVSFLMINIGFMLRALMPVTAIPDFLPVHAYAVGGIGTITISMMSRVTLGHTGRNVHQSPPVVALLLVGMGLSVVFRVFLSLVDMAHYTLWITLSGVAWTLTFGLFVLVFAPMLVRPRVDAAGG